MSAGAKVDVLAVMSTEIFTRGESDFGFPVVKRVFVERLGSRWAVKSNSYFIDETPAFDGTPRMLPAGTKRGGYGDSSFIHSTCGTKREAIAALARVGGAA